MRHGRRRDQGRAARRRSRRGRWARAPDPTAPASPPSTAASAGLSSISSPPAGRDAFERLAARADILIENFRPGVMHHLGLDYAALSTANPRLIYASISGYGQTGPDAAKGGFDLVAQGVSGLMSVTGESGRPPVKSGVPLTDLGAGLFALAAILAALHHRHRTGRGQYIDTSLVEAGLALSVWEASRVLCRGRDAASPRIRASVSRAVSGGPMRRRLHHDRRRHRPAVRRAVRRSSGIRSGRRHADFADTSSRVRNRAALIDRIEAIIGETDEGALARALRGSAAFRAGRSTPTPTRLPIRRSWRGRWSSRSITPCSVRSGHWDRRSRCPRRRPWWAVACLASASTRARCCARPGSARRRLISWCNRSRDLTARPLLHGRLPGACPCGTPVQLRRTLAQPRRAPSHPASAQCHPSSRTPDGCQQRTDRSGPGSRGGSSPFWALPLSSSRPGSLSPVEAYLTCRE